tara:strand:- start:26 stop:280 length:255 start_codon:yes stop_codon:yes gene_type:complete
MTKLCNQAFIFLVIACLSLLGSILLKGKIKAIISEIIVIAVITYILNWLCKNGYKKLSWVLMFIPSIAYLFLLMIMISVATKKA